ncbi:uncharacterized protein PFL1_00563 [Pseudozyma flocculosa PF-1]|uniref:Related to allantoate permease n=1 Tax=Pseudozyma flocculosa TaxID=84751 RepID=A0A5C3EUH0_9BASI|nr:uncharacterized protein PFL1_00563 [Pseudozyma flocculosa PF-1]EPQ32367.1 hypothetical protein PFL1_00563 [Pseudozyma flocculosa PF-1]SPO34661.1 related to allantoate permease [Pseudozyma flocculosa]
MAPSIDATHAVEALPHGGLPSSEELIQHIPLHHRKFLEDPEALAAWHEPYVPGSPEEKALVRKISVRLIPMIWLCYVLNYMDRTNIGLAKVGGMSDDLNLDSNRYSVALLIFFVGYLLFEVPSNMILTKSRPSIFLAAIMFTWGCITIAFKGINSYGALVALRFILGIIESGFFPGCLVLFSSLYKKNELSKVFGIFYSASIVSGAFGGLLAAAIIDGMDGLAGVAGWRWLFVMEGLATAVVAMIAVFVLPDYPATTRWLTPREKALAVKRLVIQNASTYTGEEVGHRQGFMLAVKDWKTWAFTVGYMAISGAGTISYFIPTIVTQLGYKGTDAKLFSVPPYAVALVFSLTVNFSADHFREKPFHAAVPVSLAGIFCVVQATYVPRHASYALLCFVAAGIWSALPCYLSYVTSVMVEPIAKRAVAIAIVNSLGNFASVYGSFLWPSNTAPEYVQGWSVTAAFCFLAAIVPLAVRYIVGPLKDTDAEVAKHATTTHHDHDHSRSTAAAETASYDDDKKVAADGATQYKTADA